MQEQILLNTDLIFLDICPKIITGLIFFSEFENNSLGWAKSADTLSIL